jgi:hypothetical protein
MPLSEGLTTFLRHIRSMPKEASVAHLPRLHSVEHTREEATEPYVKMCSLVFHVCIRISSSNARGFRAMHCASYHTPSIHIAHEPSNPSSTPCTSPQCHPW